MLHLACRLAALCFGLAIAPAATAVTPVWTLVAKSDVIVVGTPDTPAEALQAAAVSGTHDYVTVLVRRVTALKGTAADDLTVRYYSRPSPFSPAPGGLIRQNGRTSVLFLVRSDYPKPSTFYYFGGDSPDAIIEATPAMIGKIKSEIARQKEFLAAWRPDRTAPRYAEVKRILDRIAKLPPGERSLDAQQALFGKLVGMGPEAVPTIVSLMDDRRPLAFPGLALENDFPGAFERLRHYSPELMVDALTAVLNQITGENFGDIDSGGSESHRRAAVDGWRIFAAMQQPPR